MNIIKKIFNKRHYLLADGMHSCMYIPKHTYRYLNKRLIKSVKENPKAENSLRFLWIKMSDRYYVAVNPENINLNETHGLTLDEGKRIIIPCPYLQQIYAAYQILPEYCGRLYLQEQPTSKIPALKLYMLCR